MNIHLSADDSKYFDQNRHVFVVSDFEQVNDTDYISVLFEPTFRLITTAPNQLKSNGYQHNADDLITMLGIEGAALFTGGNNDNANDAQQEIPDTVDKIQRRVDASEDKHFWRLNGVNGVSRRPIAMGHPYHINNLSTMHASKGMAGDTINAEHEQCHHCQTLMTQHSVHNNDCCFYQAMIGRVMGPMPRVKVKAWRERQQCCLINQRHAAYVVSLLNTQDPTGVMCLVVWSLWFANFSRSNWKRRASREITTWLTMPVIILGLHFEDELGNYFEQGYAWHNRRGPFYSRSGLWRMEIHDYFYDFQIAWWNAAVDDPKVCMPNTMSYLENNFVGEERKTRRKQVLRGLKMDRKEIMKMTKIYLLKPPIVLLVLSNRKHGAPFLQAILSIPRDNLGRVPDNVALVNDPGNKWDHYIHTNANEQPPDKKRCYELLTQREKNVEDLILFWRQFCLNWPILTADLQRLRKFYGAPSTGKICEFPC